jgi:hypothetical protein
MALVPILQPAVLRLAETCCEWIREHAIAQDHMAEFWGVFDPLMDAFITWQESPLAWLTTSAMCGKRAIFNPVQCDPTLTRQHWDYRQAIQNLGERRKVLHTTAICLSVLRDGRPLQIHSHLSAPQKRDTMWHVNVAEFSARLASQMGKLEARVRDLCDHGFADPDINALDRLLELGKGTARLQVSEPLDTEGLDDVLTPILGIDAYNPLYRYVAIVTAICKDWSRITMLPSIFPAGHLNLPGGLVVCEKNTKGCLSIDDLRLLQAVASIAYWPWQLTARSLGKRELIPSIEHIVESSDNDYRRLEYIFGGEMYTLTDSVLAGLETLQLQDREHSGAPVIGDADPLNEDGSLVVDVCAAKSRERLRSSANLNGLVKKRERERHKRLRNIGANPGMISVLIPLVPDRDRMENMKHVLAGLGAQTIHNHYQDAFQLVLIVDGNDYAKSGCTGKDNPIVQMVNEYVDLEKTPVKIVQRRTGPKLGRSSVRNVGLSMCDGEIVQLLDDSMVLDPHYLLEILIRYGHLRGQQLAILGFKERLVGRPEDSHVRSKIKRMIAGEGGPVATDDWKIKECSRQGFAFAHKSYTPNAIVNFMDMTGDLCFLSGGVRLGSRALEHFFTTGLSAVPRETLIEAGGFNPLFDADWGMEDTFMGALLLARGTRLVPCFSARAYDLQHEKDDDKTDLKEGRRDEIPSQDVYKDEMMKPLTSFTRKTFMNNVASKLRQCGGLWPPNMLLGT